MTWQNLKTLLSIMLACDELNLAESDGLPLLLGDAPQQMTMLGCKMTCQILQGYFLAAVLTPLAGHPHPLACSFML